ncbi:unnamed protein product [Eruca vesicaria subsp. sativa]|uniref:Uncharacterized protein n=1 Tax=Eruca vesicaria subsp. sativa TaxID=29727 RepID=A0ABC8LGH6_ERUVS|nr:unnamed protein product [Eruca vesicaria subsp. sativa]
MLVFSVSRFEQVSIVSFNWFRLVVLKRIENGFLQFCEKQRIWGRRRSVSGRFLRNRYGYGPDRFTRFQDIVVSERNVISNNSLLKFNEVTWSPGGFNMCLGVVFHDGGKVPEGVHPERVPREIDGQCLGVVFHDGGKVPEGVHPERVPREIDDQVGNPGDSANNPTMSAVTSDNHPQHARVESDVDENARKKAHVE